MGLEIVLCQQMGCAGTSFGLSPSTGPSTDPQKPGLATGTDSMFTSGAEGPNFPRNALPRCLVIGPPSHLLSHGLIENKE